MDVRDYHSIILRKVGLETVSVSTATFFLFVFLLELTQAPGLLTARARLGTT